MTGLVRFACLVLALSLALPGGALARCEDHVPQPKPQNVGRDITGHDMDTIQDRGWISFAVFEDYPPYSYEVNGKPAGIDIEIGKIIAEDLGVEPRFQMVAAGENLEADLRNHLWRGPIVGGRVANVMLRVPYDSEFACRVEQVVFTGQYVEERIAIAYREDAYPDNPPTPAYFRFDLVGVENDSISDFYLTSFARGQLNANIRRFTTTEEAMAALAAGDVVAVVGPRAQLDYSLADGLGVHEPPLPGLAVGKWTIGTAIRHNYRPLAYSVDDAIRYALEDGRIPALYEAAGLSFYPPER